MLRFGVWLAEALNNVIPPSPTHRQLALDKLSVEGYQEREYQEAERVCPEFGALWDVAGKRLLDVGSGLGGKPTYYAHLGARSVTAIDLRTYSARSALALARERQLQNVVWPMVGDAVKMPFPDNSFDVIVSINVFEHIDDLPTALAECKRVLRPGALIFLHFPPFYSPWGPHMENWIDFPWPHLLFSDKTLIETARRVEERRKNNADYIPSAQVDWENLDRLPELNRATVRQFTRMIRALDLTVVESRMLPFGWRALAHRGPLARGALALLMLLSTLPLLREVITTKMVFVLTKP
jgi:ubiquinone/menaquinone biosynthesis C-methylase UbiE